MNRNALSRWIPIIIIILVTVFYNVRLGSILIFAYIIYLVITNRAGFFSWLAIRKYKQYDFQGALDWFEKAAKSKRVPATVLLSYALVLLKTGDFDTAESVLDRAENQELSDYNKNALAAMRGLLTWKRGRPGQAVVELRRLADEFKNITLYGALGSLYIKQGMYDQAITLSEEGLELDKYDKIITDNLARAHYLKGDVEQADELLDDLIDREVKQVEPYLNKALILEERGEIEEADRLVERAKGQPYSHLSYLDESEVEEIMARIEGRAAEVDGEDEDEQDEEDWIED
jgi:tetratricopeptide (TPR) repeat protein